MELDTSPFHTIESYPANRSLMVAFQFLLPHSSSKQSWTFDSGGSPQTATPSLSSHSTKYTVPSVSSDKEALNFSDSRAFDGRENGERVVVLDPKHLAGKSVTVATNTVSTEGGLAESTFNDGEVHKCWWKKVEHIDSNYCRVNLECDNQLPSDCENPSIVDCIHTYRNALKMPTFSEMRRQRSHEYRRTFCFDCSREEYFSMFDNINSKNVSYSGSCSNAECFLDISCDKIEDSVSRFELPMSRLEDQTKYTIKSLSSPYYSNASSYLFGDNSQFSTNYSENLIEDGGVPSRIFGDAPSNSSYVDSLVWPAWLQSHRRVVASTIAGSQPHFTVSNITTEFKHRFLSSNASGWSQVPYPNASYEGENTFGNFWSDFPSDPDDDAELATAMGNVTFQEALHNYDFSFLFLTLFILAGGGGNILVCLSICLEKKLHNVTNYFLMSLAVADLLVSLVVMPFGAIAGFCGYWPFGVVWCNIYISCDVLACTSSIMHMCTISLGRYMGIRNPLKTRHNSKKMVGLKVVLVWCSAMSVTSLITVLGIVDPLNIMPAPNICAINNRAFFFVGSVCAFFVPMVIMVISYALTVHLLRKKAKFACDTPAGKARTMGRYRSVKKKSQVNNTQINKTQVNKKPLARPYPYGERLELSRTYANGASLFDLDSASPETHEPSTAESIEQDTRNFRMKALRLQLVGSAAWHLRFLATKKRNALAANAVATEQKASKVLGLVFFAFLVCWTPFFLLTVYMAACPGCSVHPQLANMVLWLGYVSSTINPVIYTVFNRTFRSSFISLLCCRYALNSGPHSRGFSGSDNTGPCAGGGGGGRGGGPHGPPPTTCSIHTLSTYVRSPSFPTPPLNSSQTPTSQEHNV